MAEEEAAVPFVRDAVVAVAGEEGGNMVVVIVGVLLVLIIIIGALQRSIVFLVSPLQVVITRTPCSHAHIRCLSSPQTNLRSAPLPHDCSRVVCSQWW
jgi:hypothetical protein